jgi:hypothetical protein
VQEPSAAEQLPQDQSAVFEATVKLDAPFEFQEPAAGQPAAEARVPAAEEPLPSGDDLKAFESAFVITGTDDAAESEVPSVEAPAEPPAAEGPSQEGPSSEPQFPAPEAAGEPEPAVQEAVSPAPGVPPGGISLDLQSPAPEEQPATAAEEPPTSVDEPQPAAVEEPRLTVGEPQLSVGVPEQRSEGLSLEPRSDTPFESPMEAVAAASPEDSAEEKTVVFGPGQMPETSGGETLVYQGGDPSSTSRRTEASLSELAVLEPPGTVDKTRIKTMAFLYASGEERLCADVLAALDAICLKSESKPMFIKRAFVKPCADDMKGGLAQQMVAEAGASGVFCVGSVSQEALYDIENSFNSAGLFFRHFSSDNFGLSSALDSVLDLILKP